MGKLAARWEIAPDPRHLGAVRRQVATFAARAGVPAGALPDVQVAVSDAVTNAILHADPERHDTVRVQAEEVGDELVVRVCDGHRRTAGSPICPGLGPRLSMIAALAQVFGIRRGDAGSTEISMHFALARG